MNLFSILPKVLQIAGNILGIGTLKDAGAAIKNLQLSPEQEAQLNQALMVHEAAMKQLSIDEMKIAMSESVAMIQSDDTYTKRARPTALYAATAITAGLAAAMIFGSHLDTGAITALLLPLWGA